MIQYGDDTAVLFDKAAAQVHTLAQRPTNSELLLLYALYKQATVGNNRTPMPSMMNFQGKAKWNAWYSQSGKGKIRCQEEYISLVNELTAKYGESSPPV